MRFDSVAALAFLATAAIATPGLAQDQSSVPEHLLGMVGNWRLEQEDQSLPFCPLVFTEDQTAAGSWLIQLPEPCPAPFPPATAFAAWTVDDATGAVLITDAQNAVTLRLVEGEDGLYMTEPGVLPAFYLTLPYDEDGMGGEAADQ